MKSPQISQMDTDFLLVISLWQPWATWVMWGWKPIETRTHARFASLMSKRTGIHAAKRWDDRAMVVSAGYLSHRQRVATLNADHARGALICTGFVSQYSSRLTSADEKGALIECRTPRTGIWIQDIETFSPSIPMIGRQGVWKVPFPLTSTSNLRESAKSADNLK